MNPVLYLLSLSLLLPLCAAGETNLTSITPVVAPAAAVQATNTAAKKAPVITFDPMDEVVLEIIPLRSIDYETVEIHCRPIMNDKGTMTYMKSRNVIIVRDTKRAIKHIKDFLAAVDKPAVNVRIDVSFAGTSQRNRTDVGADIHYGKGHSGKIIIKDGKVVRPRGVSIHATADKQDVMRNTKQFLVVKSGSAASLWVGKEIVDPSWLNNYRLVPALIIKGRKQTVIIPAETPGFVWRNVGASLRIKPRYMDNGLIDVEVYPEVSYVDGKGRRQAVKVESVSTRLTMQNGQTMRLGSVVNANESFYANLFGPRLKYDNDSSILDMSITARVLKPSPVRSGGEGEMRRGGERERGRLR